MVMFYLSAVQDVFMHVLFLRLDRVSVHLLQHGLTHLDIADKCIAAALGEVLSNDDAQHL